MDKSKQDIEAESSEFLPYLKTAAWVFVVDISPTSKIVYQYLCSMDNWETIRPSLSYLAKALRIHKNTARSALEELRKYKFIIYEASKGHTTNTYKILEPDFEQIIKLIHKDFHYVLDPVTKKDDTKRPSKNWTVTVQKLDGDSTKIGPHYDPSINIQNNVYERASARDPYGYKNTHTILETLKPEIQTAEQPEAVLKEESAPIWSQGDFMDSAKGMIIEGSNEKLAQFVKFSLVGNLNEEIDEYELSKIKAYARRNSYWLKKEELDTPEIFANKIKNIQKLMNKTSQQPQGETKTERINNLLSESITINHEPKNDETTNQFFNNMREETRKIKFPRVDLGNGRFIEEIYFTEEENKLRESFIQSK